MFVLLSLILLAATVFLHLQKNRIGTVICAVGLLVLALARPFFADGPKEKWARFDGKTKKVMTDVLADSIAERHAGQRIVLVTAPDASGLSEKHRNKETAGSRLEKALRSRGFDPVVRPVSLGKRVDDLLAE